MEAGGARRLAGFKDFYQFTAPTRVIAGRGLIESAGFEFTKEGASRPLVVTDQVIRATGLVERVVAGLEDGGLECAGVFDAVPQDSSTDVVAACAEAAREAGADSFLAVGGGSVMDTAKAADVLFTHGGQIRDWEGFFGLPRDGDGMGRPQELAPLACIPTTAGTGSEVSFAAVVKDPEEGLKMEVADFPLFPRLAILDPASTATLPAAIAASTGMDALTHAIEGYVSSEWNPHADACALHALRLIGGNLERAVTDTGDEDARGNMLVAAALAIAHRLRRDRHHPLDVAPMWRALRSAARRGERDQPAPRDPLERGGRERHRRPLPGPLRGPRRGERRLGRRRWGRARRPRQRAQLHARPAQPPIRGRRARGGD